MLNSCTGSLMESRCALHGPSHLSLITQVNCDCFVRLNMIAFFQKRDRY